MTKFHRINSSWENNIFLTRKLKIKKSRRPYGIRFAGFYFPGGDEGDRTPDLLHAMQALSQLSYAPVVSVCVYPTKSSIH